MSEEDSKKIELLLTYDLGDPPRYHCRWVWLNKSVGSVACQLQMAKEAGAAGLSCGSYMHSLVDSGGEDIGIGPCPNPQYWEALRA